MGAKLRVYGIEPESIVDGPGLRYAIFVQGCTHHCPGCHNPESQPAEGGMVYDVEAIFEDIRAYRMVRRVTFSGGEPFEQPVALAELAKMLKAAGYQLWSYTGYLYEDLLRRDPETPEGAATRELLDCVDVLVDGPFVLAKRSLDLEWRGSSNQRLINLAAMRRAGSVAPEDIILWKSAPAVSPSLLVRPQSW